MSSGVTYEIEGDFDFFKELKNISSNKTDSSSSAILGVEDTPAEKCLITDEKLRKDHITLKCGHKFNYVPLFKEVVFQKCSLLPKNVSSKIVTTYIKNTGQSSTSSTAQPANTSATSSTFAAGTSNSNIAIVTYNSSYNLETTKVQYNEIKCPYCRSITPHILPYYAYPDVSKIKYVNIPADLALPVLSCEYHQYVVSDKSKDNDAICRTSCIYHEKYDRMLCNKHFNKLETDAANVPTKKTRASSTVRKPKKSDESANICDENVIISHHNPATTVCSFTLLSGPRKGISCGKPVWFPKNGVSLNLLFCKVHYDKHNK